MCYNNKPSVRLIIQNVQISKEFITILIKSSYIYIYIYIYINQIVLKELISSTMLVGENVLSQCTLE